MSKFKFTLEKCDRGDDDHPDWDYIVEVTPEFTGGEQNPLSLSIEKWEFIVETLRENPGIEINGGGRYTCALCTKYWARHKCGNCPVAESAGHPSCRGTPYTDWMMEHDLISAQAELEFLRGLKEDERE